MIGVNKVKSNKLNKRRKFEKEMNNKNSDIRQINLIQINKTDQLHFKYIILNFRCSTPSAYASGIGPFILSLVALGCYIHIGFTHMELLVYYCVNLACFGMDSHYLACIDVNYFSSYSCYYSCYFAWVTNCSCCSDPNSGPSRPSTVHYTCFIGFDLLPDHSWVGCRYLVYPYFNLKLTKNHVNIPFKLVKIKCFFKLNFIYKIFDEKEMKIH